LLDINVDSIEKGELKMQRLMTTLERTPACAKFFEKHDKAVRAKGKAEGIAEGIVRGISKGIAEGKAEGISEGIAKGKAENIIRILTRRFDKSPSMRLQRQIMNVKDIDKLDELCDFAFDCVSLGEFATAFN
ncbi:MAG: hypothetical protein LBP59_18380, partial [Planctomycetaceae bacterium]|jgi:flagellar biosynthesis/type III secretory pathway protein FliH|nr:hypothetical protein [Planctomycetaceae bacterium]